MNIVVGLLFWLFIVAVGIPLSYYVLKTILDAWEDMFDGVVPRKPIKSGVTIRSATKSTKK